MKKAHKTTVEPLSRVVIENCLKNLFRPFVLGELLKKEKAKEKTLGGGYARIP